MGCDEIMDIINKFIPTYEISSIASKFGSYLLDNYKEVEDYISLIKKEKKLLSDLCKQYNIPNILNHSNTIYLKPKNLNKVKEYLNEQNVLFRTRILPYDKEEWVAIVLYPNFVDSDIFKKIESIQEVFYKIIPDDIDTISSYLIELSDNHIADIIITTGGTGLGPRDLTPEATKNVLDKEIPGITEAMRLETLKKTNLSMLSRGISGLRKKCLIINLPGSPKAVSECLEIIEPVLEHALTIISGKTSHK